MLFASSPVESFVANQDVAIQDLLQQIRRIIWETVPECSESIKWGVPCYDLRGLLCGLSPANGYVRIDFFNGVALEQVDAEGLLKGSGRTMRHIKVEVGKPVQEDVIRFFLAAAIRVNSRGWGTYARPDRAKPA